MVTLEKRKRIGIEAWKKIFKDTYEKGHEIEIVFLETDNEWCLCVESQLLEDFNTEDEAKKRLDFLRSVNMGELKIVGYFADKDRENKEVLEAKNVFVVIDSNEGWLEGYCPIGQHFELKDKEYLEVGSDKITLEQYKEASKLFYTPEDYLIGESV